MADKLKRELLGEIDKIFDGRKTEEAFLSGSTLIDQELKNEIIDKIELVLKQNQLIDMVKAKYTLPEVIDWFIPDEENDVADRWGLFPIKDIPAYNRYKQALAAFWSPDSVSFDDDRNAFNQLTDSEKNFLSNILSIFAFLDGAVANTLLTRFLLEARTLEQRIFMINQAQMEVIHSENYSQQIQAITSSNEERMKLMRAVNHMPFLQEFVKYVDKYTRSSLDYRFRMVANAALEGIGFSALFAGIFYFKFKPVPAKLKGIIFSNEEISKDEGMHRNNAVALYLDDPKSSQADKETITEIVIELVKVSHNAIDNFQKEDFPTLTRQDLKTYVEFVADGLLRDLGFSKYWNVNNSIPWMNTIGIQGKTSFFERQTEAYNRATDVDGVEPSIDF